MGFHTHFRQISLYLRVSHPLLISSFMPPLCSVTTRRQSVGSIVHTCPHLVSDQVLLEEILSGELLCLGEMVDPLPHEQIREGDAGLRNGTRWVDV